MTTLQTTTTTEYRKRVYFDGSPTRVLNDKTLTPLMKACMYGRSEQVKLILNDKVYNISYNLLYELPWIIYFHVFL